MFIKTAKTMWTIIGLLVSFLLMNTSASLLSHVVDLMDSLMDSSTTSRSIRYKFDPQAKMTTMEIIHYNGYPAERHQVITRDGYILEMHRIPRGRYNSTVIGRPPIFMQHGIIASSSSWVLNGAKDSPAFIFADEGYDVWLGNIRGNRYSRRHDTISPEDPRFWEFTLDDHAMTDLPAMIDYILEVTAQEKLTYMGYSLGGTIGTMLLSGRPEYNQKVDVFSLLSPALDGRFIRNPLKLLQYHFAEANEWFSIFPTKELLPHNEFRNKIFYSMCLFYPGVIFCELIRDLVSGYNDELLDRSRLHVHVPQLTAGSSWKIIEHYVQIGNAGTMQRFDYGPTINLEKYYSVHPPEYNFSQISAPTVVYWGYMDLFMDQKHMDSLESKLPNVKKIDKVADLGWTHADFITAIGARSRFYDGLLQLLNRLR